MVAAEQQPYASLRDGETVVRELSKEFDIELIIVPEKELEDLGLEIPANYNTSDIKFNKKQITIIRELIPDDWANYWVSKDDIPCFLELRWPQKERYYRLNVTFPDNVDKEWVYELATSVK